MPLYFGLCAGGFKQSFPICWANRWTNLTFGAVSLCGTTPHVKISGQRSSVSWTNPL